MKIRTLAVMGSLAFAITATTASAEEMRKRDYLELVMGTFLNHIQAIEMLTATPNKYADNVVRHAEAISRTEGLLDHVFPGDKNTSSQKWPWKTEPEFDKLAAASKRASVQFEGAAQTWIKDRDTVKFLAALETLKQTCRDCHGKAKDWP
ncbi:MAG: cytochrome c [Alphaproteobacteria bacterium]